MNDTDCSIESLIKDEEALESGAISEAVDRYYQKLKEAKRSGGDTSLFTPELKLIMEHAPKLAAAITADLNSAGGAGTKFFKSAYGDIKPIELAVLVIRHCFNNYVGNQTIQTICIKLADDIRVHKDDKRFEKDFKAYRAVVSRSIKSSHMGHRHRVMTAARRKMGVEDTIWEKKDKLLIGKKLVDLFLFTSGLFYVDDFVKPNKTYVARLKRYVLGKGTTIVPTKYTKDWLEKNHASCSILTPVLKPMVVPPVEWTTPYDGGYVSQKFSKGYQSCRLIRGVKRQWLNENAHLINQRVYDAVNAIQSTPYRINKRVLDVVDELKMSGLAGLPDGKLPALKIPPKPWQSDEEFDRMKAAKDKRIKEWSAVAHKLYQDYWNEKSKRTSLLEKIRLARMFQDYERIYFPVNLDWRGRTFCMSTPTLTPQGDDPAKGCIEYADGQVVTEEGLRELRIHGANVFGMDKLSEQERVNWVEINNANIAAVADNPYGEFQLSFWSKADKPFQFLAFCFDYAGYLLDPQHHESHLICAIDQTCSGLQHWSAVLRDGEGGSKVGMVDKPMPDDIYQAVADEVEKRLEFIDDPLAEVWRGKVTRTITKRNVMTKLYGATMPGMRDQVKKELDKLDKKGDGRYLEGCPVDNFKAAAFIAEQNNLAMGSVVAKATQGMDYVQACAALLADAGKPVEWISPIGVPIQQTYWRTDTQKVQTYWLSIDIKKTVRKNLRLSNENPNRGIQKKKAENSIAPNFIHSMDASHLLFIALAWKETGCCLTTIHDSFGTHCNDVPKLHKVVRETFIKMYDGNDWLYEFARGIATYHPEITEITRPAMGTMDFEQIKTATYFCR